MNYFRNVVSIVLFFYSISVSAVVVNELNGQQYEWLELTETVDKSRTEVEMLLNDVTSNLYGYEYASRSLVEDLFLSYTPWSTAPDNGWYGNTDVLAGLSDLMNSFGPTRVGVLADTSGSLTTLDNGLVKYNAYAYINGYMGTSSECEDLSCRAYLRLNNYNGINTSAFIYDSLGWDSNSLSQTISVMDSSPYMGSFLVRSPSVVPLPAAAWLFGSALLGFFGFSRRKANA